MNEALHVRTLHQSVHHHLRADDVGLKNLAVVKSSAELIWGIVLYYSGYYAPLSFLIGADFYTGIEIAS